MLERKRRTRGFKAIAEIPNVKVLIALNTINIFFTVFIWTISPLWMTTSLTSGGLGLEMSTISIIYFSIAIPKFFLEVIIYPILSNSYSQQSILRAGLWLSMPIWVLMALTTMFNFTNTGISIYLIVLFTLRIFFGFLSSSALTILINVSCKIRERGKMNGLTLIFQSLS